MPAPAAILPGCHPNLTTAWGMNVTGLNKLAASVVALLVVANVFAADSTGTRPLTVDDLLALKSVSQPAISPEGNWIAYAVETVDVEADESSTQIFMVSRDGKDVLPLTAEGYSASTPRWSPDGRYLGFLATRGEEEDARTQVWTLDRRGGEAQQYTSVTQGVTDFRWSPDGQAMLLLIKDQSAQELADEAADEASEESKPLPYVIDRLQFKRDGVPYLDRSRTHLYVTRGRNEDPVQLTFGDYDDDQPAWRPDGKEIAFVSNRTAEPDNNENTDLWIVSVDAGAGRQEPRRVTSNPGSDHSPAWSNDGRWLAYVTVTEPDLIWYATNHLAMVAAAGGEERVLSATLDRNVIAPAFTPDDAGIIFALEDSAEQHLARYDLGSGRIDRPVEGNLAVREFSQNRSGDVALLMSTPDLPPELFLLADDQLNRLTATNAALLDQLVLAEVHNVTFPSADGTEIEGFIFTPPDYRPGHRYPTILRIHGGPVSQYDFSFNAEAQLLAAHGYVVVICNPRGSSGYGQDFSAALFANWGVPDFADVSAAVDYAVAQGYADPDRLGVGGWSYGGILTNYVITKSDRFKAAISGASEVNYAANYGHDHYQYFWEAELGLPWESKETWERISPWENVDKIVTPTLVMGGKEDWNVPVQNSEQLYQALKRRGIDTQLVVYPGETHSISRPSFRKDRWQRYLDWYDGHLRGR